MLYQVIIPLSLLVVPWFLVRYLFKTPESKHFSYGQAVPYLGTAAGLWFVGCAIPEFPLFGGQTTTFLLHSIGGVVAAVLFWFVVAVYKWKFVLWWQEAVALFAFVCTLGVMNELLEFFLHHTGYLTDKGADTWWDLVANTLGMSLAFFVVWAVRRIRIPG